MRRPSLAAIAGLLLVGSVGASLGGCVSLLPKTKPAQLYRFGAEGTRQLEANASGVAVEGPSDARKIGVVLGQIGFPRASTSDGILTVTGDQTAYIAGARWVAPARTLFQEAVERAFERDGKTVQIVQVGDVGAAGAVLRIDVTAFEVRYHRVGETNPVATVAISARLTRSDGGVMDQRTFSALEPAGSNTVSTIVRAFNSATDHILTDVVAWADLQVSQAAAAPASAGLGPGVVTTSTSTTSTRSQTGAASPPRR